MHPNFVVSPFWGFLCMLIIFIARGEWAAVDMAGCGGCPPLLAAILPMLYSPVPVLGRRHCSGAPPGRCAVAAVRGLPGAGGWSSTGAACRAFPDYNMLTMPYWMNFVVWGEAGNMVPLLLVLFLLGPCTQYRISVGLHAPPPPSLPLPHSAPVDPHCFARSPRLLLLSPQLCFLQRAG